jgi:hypothetical protein
LIPPAGGWVPYVAPVYGGVEARVLNIHRAPGPKTNTQHGGSGFLYLENDDASAERFATLLGSADIPVGETQSWNGYPLVHQIACSGQPSWRPVSSRYGGCLVSCPGCGWS